MLDNIKVSHRNYDIYIGTLSTAVERGELQYKRGQKESGVDQDCVCIKATHRHEVK
jgi:hypothetical protein